MPRTELDHSESLAVIASCDVVGVAFQGPARVYLIALGYSWMDFVMCGVTDFAASAPAWWRDEQLSRMAAGGLLAWRLTPLTMTGIRYAPGSPPR